MRRLQVHADDPSMKHLAKGAQQNDSVPARVVVITFQDVAESRSWVAVHQVVAHGALESFEFPLVPGHEDLRILNVGADLQARAFEVAGMELWRVIDYEEFRHAVALPAVLDSGK